MKRRFFHSSKKYVFGELGKKERLPTLNTVCEKLPVNFFSKTLIVGIQHQLDSTEILSNWLSHLGAHIIMAGKIYSNVDRIIESSKEIPNCQIISIPPPIKLGSLQEDFWYALEKKLWPKVDKHLEQYPATEHLILLDDGGHLHSNDQLKFIKNKYPHLHISGVEQTTRGTRALKGSKKGPHCNVINIAGTAGKRFIESHFIGEAVWENLYTKVIEKEGLNPNTTEACLCGHGVIGAAIIRHLHDSGYDVTICNSDPTVQGQHVTDASKWITNLSQKINLNSQKSLLIIGASGYDVTQETTFTRWNNMTRDVYLVSASSEDEEFKSLLCFLETYRNISKEKEILDGMVSYLLSPGGKLTVPRLNNFTKENIDILGNIYYRNNKGYAIKIFRGGTPINFDNKVEPTPLKYIDFTITLLLAGLMKAKELPIESKKQSYFIKLDPQVQVAITRIWLSHIGPLNRKNLNVPAHIIKLFESDDHLAWVNRSSKGIDIDTPQLMPYFVLGQPHYSYTAR